MQSVHEEHRKFQIQVGTVKLEFDTPIISAGTILADVGAKPVEDFVLEALNAPNGKVAAEFSAKDPVDLNDHDRKFFRAVPRGGGRA